MTGTRSVANDVPADAASTLRIGCELFLISLLILFLELACIRWFSAHVLFLTFFTNTVLLACFLGMSLGCLAAGQRRRYLSWTPVLLAVALAAPHGVFYFQERFQVVLDLDQAQARPQVVFFGTEYPRLDLAQFVVPMEAVVGGFFLLLALAFIGLGQELGMALKRLPNPLHAYTLNIFGSLAGIVLFVACSWAQLAPFWWFLVVVLGLGYFLFQGPWTAWASVRWSLLGILLFLVLRLADPGTGTSSGTGQYVTPSLHDVLPPAIPARHATAAQTACLWSPYYRIDYEPPPSQAIHVNLIIHQHMISRTAPAPSYALPHLLQRDAGGQPFRDVLVIGAGSGNDVSRALQWGAAHVDAVEIDPVILELGRKAHPDRPYQDERVSVHLNDGRSFLRTTERQYDLIVYALLDSLVLHTGYSNIRLESYLFTREALADVRRRLKPGGLFVMYNYFRQGWIIARLRQGLAEAFEAEPLVLTVPYRETISPDERWDGFTVLLAGNVESLQNAFARHRAYWLPSDQTLGPETPHGFVQQPRPQEQSSWQRFGLAEVLPPAEALPMASDDWPFLYLRRPMIPELSLRGLLVMGSLSLLLLGLFLPQRQGPGESWSVYGHMFLLGAGFMLVETKAVVQLALLFGSTWTVNAVVIFAILVMFLIANLLVLRGSWPRLGPAYVGLLATVALSSLLPLDVFLGWNRALQVVGACLLLFAPILFAGVLFAVSFGRTRAPSLALGANIAGAMMGGLAESSSMLLGFQYLGLVALVFYSLAALLLYSRPEKDPETPPSAM